MKLKKYKNVIWYVVSWTLPSTLYPLPSRIASAKIPAGPTMGDIIRTTWNEAIRPAIIFLFVLATVVFIWGLIEFVGSADSEEGRTRGKRNIIWGIVGMTIMFATGAIMTVLDNFFKSL